MSDWLQHLIILPILLPMMVGAMLAPMDETRRRAKVTLALLAAVAQLLVALTLMWQADLQPGGVPAMTYLLGNWPVPFGIALVVDRLSALMLVITAILAVCTLVFSSARWDRVGVHFHSLFQFLLMGVNGAFLTNDLFNLFVFFEVMLAASYGLLLHGSGKQRVSAGLHYVAMNLAASSVFLIGVSLMYAATGTLNMAHLAQLIPLLDPADQHLLETGAAILAIAFLMKAAVWPLNFWLTRSYGSATPPVGAMFAIMTKVGVYALLRLWLLLFSNEAGAAAGFGGPWLLYGALATLAVASLGMFAAPDFKKFAGYSVIASSGTLIAALAMGSPQATAALLYYLIGSTLGVAAFYLLIDLLERVRDFGANLLAVTQEAFEAEGMVLPEQEEIGVAIPGAMAFLGLAFFLSLLLLSGMPPLSGFLGKFAILVASLRGEWSSVPWTHWVYLFLLIFSGLTAAIGLMRLGIRLFWVPANLRQPRLRVTEAGPVAALLVCCVMLAAGAGPVMGYLDRTAEGLFLPMELSDAVLGAQPREGAR